LNRININNLMIIILIPDEFFPRSILNSWYRVMFSLLINIVIRFGDIQNMGGRMINPIKVLAQFNENFILVAGSKVENRFVIIFSLYYLCYLLVF